MIVFSLKSIKKFKTIFRNHKFILFKILFFLLNICKNLPNSINRVRKNSARKNSGNYTKNPLYIRRRGYIPIPNRTHRYKRVIQGIKILRFPSSCYYLLSMKPSFFTFLKSYLILRDFF